MLRSYEMMAIIRPDLDEEALTAVIDKITALIGQNGGEMENLDRWGKRRLAYEINDLREGFYVLVHFKGPAGIAKELDRILKITDDVVRHIIVRPDAA